MGSWAVVLVGEPQGTGQGQAGLGGGPETLTVSLKSIQPT